MLGPDFFAVGSKKILDWLFWIKNLDTEPNPPLLQRGIKGDFRPTAPRPHGPTAPRRESHGYLETT